MKKQLLHTLIVSTLITAAPAVKSDIIDMNFDGLFTMLSPSGSVVQNTSYPYYGDTTWGYGKRTQISGTMQINTKTGYGSGTINPFEFYDGGNVVFSSFEFQAVGSGLLLGNYQYHWGGSDVPVQIVLDASGLFAELSTWGPGDIYDVTTCAASNACSVPASNDVYKANIPIGPAPVVTSSYNVVGATGTTTTLGQLSLGADDGIGGAPMDNGPFENFNMNLDMTSVRLMPDIECYSCPQPPPVPIPAAVWLFGSGLLGLVGIAKRRKK